MRVLIETKIFPNDRDPLAAPFNRQQFEALSRLCDVELFANVPWFPGDDLIARAQGKRRVPIAECTRMGGMDVQFRRVLYVPRLGRPLSGLTYAGSLWPKIREKRGSIDAVLAAFAYPDGFAGAVLARALGVPLVVKVHGTDINLLPNMRGLRRQIQWTMRQAYAVFGPSRPLVDRAIELGANPDHARVVLNGIDRSIFCVRDRAEAKRSLALSPSVHHLLFVGRPERAKGFDELMAAMASLKDATPAVELIVIGNAPEANKYRDCAKESGLAIQFLGIQPHQTIANYLAASDALVLPSWAEGTPNVVLEALASGRRVVASAVGGIPDVMNRPEFGFLVEPRNSESLTSAIRSVVAEPYDPVRISECLPYGDWTHSAREVLQILEAAVANGKSGVMANRD